MTNQPKPSSTPRGLGLRTQLILGFVVLLAILIAVGVESISLLDRLGGSIDVILRENYKSVIACEQMKEALERMDSGALFALAGEEGEGSALAAQNRPRFAAALQTELGNITLPGEGARAERLRQLFAAYTPVLERVLARQAPVAERRALYFQRLYPTFQQIKGSADEILEMNQRNMVQANDHARHLASSASREMALLLLAGTAMAGLCIFFLSNAMLGPLEQLAWGAGEIEKGAVMASLGESRQQLHLEPVPPADLVDAVVREAAPGFEEEGVKLTADVSPEAPRVLADGERARLVLTSLLRNARAHSAAGGVVTVTAEPWQGRVRFSVADTGSGIPSAHLEQIFEPFHQVPGTQDLGGVGMGLAIARSIVQAHGGEIHGESEEGHGASFWFTLPVANNL
jgi:signal transduction histidine kinase